MIKAKNDFISLGFHGLIAWTLMGDFHPVVLGQGIAHQPIGHHLFIARMNIPTFPDINDHGLTHIFELIQGKGLSFP